MPRDVILVLIGAALGIPIAISANFMTESVRRRLAKRNSEQSQLRQAQLGRRLKQAEDLHADKLGLLLFISVRILVLNTFWIAQEAVDYVFGIFINATYSYSQLSTAADTQSVANKVGQASSGVSALIGAVFLIILVRYGGQVYKIYQRSQNIDEYRVAVAAEVSNLRELDRGRVLPS